MTKVTLIRFTVLFFLSISTAYAQKVKYKDLFGLLSGKQYEQAEPFLKRYLKDNDDNPNAYLFMGIIFQEKSTKTDVLKQTNNSIAYMDSAIIYYDIAYKMITEKEIKRNDEYYQAYNRRDLRTGEFGVKLSDVQFDIEKKKEGLRERIDKVKMVKHYFSLSDSLYKKSNMLFRALQNTYHSEKELYLRSDEETLKDLVELSLKFDSCTKAFDNYKSSVSLIGKIGYDQTMKLNEITDLKNEGTTVANFFTEDLQVWNYKKFADNSKSIIEKDITPMRNSLVSYDIEINKLREKLNHDSVSVKNDLTKLIDNLLLNQLKKFDTDPLPMDLFSLKVSDLEYRSTVLENKPLRDSADVKLQLSLLGKELKYLNRLDSTADKLLARDIEHDMQNYSYFITNTFSNSIVLNSYLKSLKEYAEREKRKKNRILLRRNESLKWLYTTADSLPLVFTVSSAKYKPLITVEDKFTAGLSYADSLSATGYFYNVTHSHHATIKALFPVDKVNFKLSRLPYAKAISCSDAGGQIYFVLIYSERSSKEKYAASLAKIYRSDGLAWSNNYALGFIPKEILFKPDTGELTIKGESTQSVIDKNGKMLK